MPNSIESAYKYMEKNGFRLTRGRRAVLQILQNEHLTFKEIQERLLQRGYHNVSSIYNILEFFIEHRLVTVIFMNNTRYYDISIDNPMHDQESHIHMMLDDGNTIVEVNNRALYDRIVDVVSRDYNVDINYIKITIGANRKLSQSFREDDVND